MRIALITPSKLPFSCGNSILAERMRAGLAGRGHTAAIFSIYDETLKDAARFAPDVVHSLHAIKPAQWVSGLLREIDAPWVITLTGTDYNSPEAYGAEHDMLAGQFASAAAIVVFHEEARQSVARGFPGAAGKLCVIPQGIEIRPRNADRLAARRSHGIGQDSVVFFMAAGIRPVKNILFAFDVLSGVRPRCPSARLILAGPIIDNSEAKRIFERGGSTDWFRYLGEISLLATRDLMAACDIYMNVSLHEGMSGAILEAMAEGVPVLASDAPGNRSLVQHGVTGLLAPCAAPGEFISAAVRLATDKKLRQQMGRAGLRAAAEFSVQAEIRRYEALYAEIIGRSAQAARR